jgi:hypothetical protein
MRHSAQATIPKRHTSLSTCVVIAPHFEHSAINSATAARLSNGRKKAAASIGASWRPLLEP